MDGDAGSLVTIAPHPEVPLVDRQAAAEFTAAAQADELRESSERVRKVEEIRKRQQDELRGLFHGEGYERWRSFLRKEKQAMIERLEPPHGPDVSREELAELHHDRRERGLQFLKEQNVDLEALRSINRRMQDGLAELIPPPQTHAGKPVLLVPASEVPNEIRAGRSNPWTIVHPPYPGWAWAYSWNTSGFGFTSGLFLDATAGLVGNYTYLSDSDAGDSDYGAAKYNTSVGFWYFMPTAGLVEVWIEGQSAASHHHVTLYDEWGWSDSSVYQHDYLTLKATGATSSGLRTSQMSWFYETGYTDGFWDNHYLYDGSTYWAHLYSDISFPAGTWVYVQVGNRTTNSTTANDVEVYSYIDFRWFIRSVWVESTGG